MESDCQTEVAPLLSVIIPAYNEARTIERVIDAVRSVEIDLEIIVVDDGSTDGSQEKLRLIAEIGAPKVRVVLHEHNRGKGAALKSGFAASRGKFVIVQDADLEYSPKDYPKLLRPLVNDVADVVYGSRFRGHDEHRVLYFWHALGNRVLTTISNMFTNLNLSDMETGYKAFRGDLIRNTPLRENRFGFEPEITARMARHREKGARLRIYEVGISYHGRTYEEGKKIKWIDGLWSLWCIVRYAWA